VDLEGDTSGHYVITVRGKLRVLFVLRRSFSYRRRVRLRGNMDPARLELPVLADFIGAPEITGANVLFQSAVLDRFIKEAVEHQLDVATTRIAGIVLEVTHSGYNAESVSVSDLQLRWLMPELQACMTISGGAITGRVLPPPFDLASEEDREERSAD
jgi:hypothetical protein